MIGRIMDPYLTLGVPKGCNREEVKEAFRVQAQHAHPDRGGEDESFIRLRTAYEQILAELDQELDPYAAKAARAPRDARRPVPPGSRAVGDTYESWFRHIAVQADRSHSGWRSPRIRTIGMMILLGIIVVSLAAFLIVWVPAPDGSLPRADSPVQPAAGAAEPEPVRAPIRLATLPRAERRWQQPPAHRPDFFVIPYDAILYFAPVEGHRGEATEFGIVTSQGDLIPIFTGLPGRPNPAGEVEIGPVSAGSRLRIYLKRNGSWVFSDAGSSKPSIESFSDRDDSLGGGGSIIERTRPATWVLHLDDVDSTDDDDEDVLIQIRLEPIED